MRRSAYALPAVVLACGLAAAQDDKTSTLDELRKEYAEFVAAEPEYMSYVNAIQLEVRDIIAFQGKVAEAREAAVKKPDDPVLKQHADELEKELGQRIARYRAREPEFKKRRDDYGMRITAILKKAQALSEKKDDLQVTIFKMRLVGDQGSWADLWADDTFRWGNVFRLHERHPEEKELQVLAGQLHMFLPPDRRHSPVPPAFDKAYALLSPIAKERPEDQVLRLLVGVCASALDKNAEAKVLLDGVAGVGSMRPGIRALIYPADGDETLTTWRDAAGTLAAKPEDVDARRKRADLLLRCGAAHLAARDAEIAHKGRPDDRDVGLLLARAYVNGNAFERAIPLYRNAVAAVASDDAVRAELALALFNANDPATAKAELEKVKQRSQLPPNLQQGVMAVMGAALEGPWQDELKAREADAKKDDNPRVKLETERGDVVIELFEDTAPNTVANFVYLAGNKFYDGVRFHRIIAGFMAQGGDPTAQGNGGPGWTIKCETAKNPRLHWRGSVSMAHAGPNTGGSQFFLCHVPTPQLNGKHTVFGRIVEGQDVVDRLEPRDAIVRATVLRKRDHEYKPETDEQFGHTPWKPGEPREGDRIEPKGEKK